MEAEQSHVEIGSLIAEDGQRHDARCRGRQARVQKRRNTGIEAQFGTARKAVHRGNTAVAVDQSAGGPEPLPPPPSEPPIAPTSQQRRAHKRCSAEHEMATGVRVRVLIWNHLHGVASPIRVFKRKCAELCTIGFFLQCLFE